MVAVRAVARAALRRLPVIDRAVISPLRRERRRLKLREIGRLGLIDPGFIGAETGRSLRSIGQAIDVLLSQGNEIAPHPLIEPQWISRGSKGRDWLTVLLDPKSPVISVGPLLDLTAVTPDADPRHLADRVAGFLRSSTSSTELPLPEGTAGPMTRGEGMRLATELAERHTAAAGLVGSRVSTTWNRRAEQRFITDRLASASARPGTGETLVSIVMPVYNREGIVARAIESVVAQDFSAWELIVVDDGSTDSTRSVVEAIAANDPRVRLVRGEHRGVSAARNLGVAEAHADVLAFLDSDNVWTPHFLSVSYSEVGSGRADLAYAAVELDRGGRKHGYLGMSGTREQLISGNSFIDMNTLVVKADLVETVGGFDEGLRRWVDYDLFLRLFAATDRVTYLPFIGVRYDHRDDALDRITTSESPHWRDVVLGKNLIDWDTVSAGASSRVRGRVSIVVPTTGQWEAPLDAVDAVLATAGEHDVEVIVIDSGSRREVAATMSLRFARDERVTVLSRPAPLRASLANNIGFAASTGEYVVFLERTATPRPGWLAPLVEAVDDPEVFAAQPLLLAPGDSVHHAGTVFGGGRMLPVPFLADHPREDLAGVLPARFHAVGAGAILVRADRFVALGGYDPTFQGAFDDVDLCLRARTDGRPASVVVPSSLVGFRGENRRWLAGRANANAQRFLDRWADAVPDEIADRFESAGFRMTGVEAEELADDPVPELVRPVYERIGGTIEAGEFAGRRRLRWAIKIASPAEPRGDVWGDTFFADDIASALRALGQEVVVDRLGAHTRSTAGFDDVVLTIRGLATVPRQDGATNVLWVISHPTRVRHREFSSNDLVYGASLRWAQHATEAHGHEVRPLLQATDPDRFHPGTAEPGTGTDVLFVGTPRKIFRPIVKNTIEAGFRPSVFGHGWEDFLDDDLIAGTTLDRADAPAMYRSARVVLNDHHGDMAEWGFLSNRLFDGVAAGARMLSDRVDGIDEVFGAAVLTADTVDETREALAHAESLVPESVLVEASQRIRAEHSFHARAHTLVTDVYAWRDLHPDTRS
ncbi:glycosyltransferase [Labedella endophytica]|uniref:Glycosyltransferase n=1 Tax=Labedella endophytica TaxID=1523160 RepID=A0A3S0VGL1_9MICO|nr:glycosyltransferase [Labedella endophytica]RUR01330.1 glycosyltransferase [Labedella endophytica]